MTKTSATKTEVLRMKWTILTVGCLFFGTSVGFGETNDAATISRKFVEIRDLVVRAEMTHDPGDSRGDSRCNGGAGCPMRQVCIIGKQCSFDSARYKMKRT